MEILIKRIFSKKKVISMETGSEEKNYLDVFFDVITEKGSYIDKDGAGYFPIEIEDKKQTEEQLNQECEDWIVKNSVLNSYKPVDPKEALIQAELRAMAEERIKAREE